ncbi:MAG: para-nitrobenzyl esterase [Hyphomicrobiaceae bacterium]|jgi:para-nitrobenzyl esterase
MINFNIARRAVARRARRIFSTSLALAAFFVVIASGAQAGIQSGVLISLADGDVQGQFANGTREFLGIPYAAPPVGPLRFRPPATVAPWLSTLDATTYPAACPQNQGTIGSASTEEDCLFLNVWTSETAPAEPLPVMVWIHGGSNTSGSISDLVPFPPFETERLYNAAKLSSFGEVVVVTVNYRLGAFGFFPHADLIGEDPSYPYAGNQGLLDQRAALLWVRDNITEFGGDPEKVTIFGESAGSWDVCAHVVSPMSEGLFHRAISQSGGCSAGVNTQDAGHAAASAISAAVGCGGAPDELACLRAVPVQDLIDNFSVGYSGSEINTSIAVDGSFMPDTAKNLFDSGEFSRVPYMLGANNDEGSLFFIGADPILTGEEYTAELFDRFGDFTPQVEAVYPSNFAGSPQKSLIRVFGDAGLVCATYDVANRVSAARRTKTRKRAKVFAYSFARVIPLEFVALLDLGAFHGAEIAYVFGSVLPPTSLDLLISETMQSFWTSFADRGRPRAKRPKGWRKFRAKSWKGMRFGRVVEKQKGYRKAQCEFWSDYYDTL